MLPLLYTSLVVEEHSKNVNFLIKTGNFADILSTNFYMREINFPFQLTYKYIFY